MGHFFYFIGKMVVNCVQKDTKKLLTFRIMICIMSKVRTRTKIEKGEKMCEFDEKLENAHMGRLIHMLSHQMKRNSNGMESVIENDELTVMQKHVLKFVLLESLHRDLYQKDIEEEFQIRKSTVTGILKLMEKHGYIYRESVEKDARLKKIVPTPKAEELRPILLKHIAFTENYLTKGISEEDVITCKKVLCQMYHNLSEMNKKTDKEADRKNEQETV